MRSPIPALLGLLLAPLTAPAGRTTGCGCATEGRSAPWSVLAVGVVGAALVRRRRG